MSEILIKFVCTCIDAYEAMAMAGRAAAAHADNRRGRKMGAVKVVNWQAALLPALNCVASGEVMINCRGRMPVLEIVMVGWPLSLLCQGRLWRIGAAKSRVHGDGVFLSWQDFESG